MTDTDNKLVLLENFDLYVHIKNYSENNNKLQR